ncbi:hypothetical protein H6F95_31935 [Cyanobacteria bacterium FACHB-471]|nr:hypothetical protein [Cyanobacteria bacterium FACHB-471]
MTNATNRSVTLIGANKIFSVVGIEIEHDPLGFYKSTGQVSLNAQTLTELCQQIVKTLAERR